jgi:hypothetical protein
MKGILGLWFLPVCLSLSLSPHFLAAMKGDLLHISHPDVLSQHSYKPVEPGSQGLKPLKPEAKINLSSL